MGNPKPKWFVAVLVACLLCLAGAVGGCANLTHFRPVSGLELPSQRMFDLGVADVDRDGSLDVFSANHKFQAAFLRNRGDWRFRDRLNDWGLGQMSEFPGLGALRAPERMDADGVYVWLTDRAGDQGRVHLVSMGRRLEATVEVQSGVSLVAADRARVSGEDGVDGSRRLRIRIDPGGSVELAVSAMGELPIGFDLTGSKRLRPAEVRIGVRGVSPPGDKFRIQLHDRHGFAFSDLNGDGIQDAYVVSGGVGGRIADPRINAMVSDQLLFSSGGEDGIRFTDLIDGSGLQKGNCRGRGSSWVDYDRDGLLDLYVTCELRPPMLFKGLGGGQFSMVESPPFSAETSRWIDLGNRRPRLVAGTEQGLEVWSFRDKGWVLEERSRRSPLASQIVGGDLDNDGRQDIAAISSGEIHLYRNTRRGLREMAWRERGLPDNEIAVALADVDNDGWLDLSTARHGLFRWDPIWRRFESSAGLAPRTTGYAVLNWPDLDNDGRRDLLAAYSMREFSPDSSVVVRANRNPAGSWLQVDLEGPSGNPEAVGARVDVEPIGGCAFAPRRITQYVGQNEGSRHSQGHYRTYFGLACARRAKLTVHWPGGGKTKRRLDANRLVTIAK